MVFPVVSVSKNAKPCFFLFFFAFYQEVFPLEKLVCGVVRIIMPCHGNNLHIYTGYLHQQCTIFILENKVSESDEIRTNIYNPIIIRGGVTKKD